MIFTRIFNTDEDFGMICNWFGERKFPNPGRDLLPPTGIVASIDGKPLACGFLFKTDAGIAMIGNLVTNPKAEKELRQKALDHLIQVFFNMAKSDDFKLVTLGTNIEKLGMRFEKLGFIKTDENVSHYRRDLCHLQQHS